jgi:MYXO-CTERM domain-containing protein
MKGGGVFAIVVGLGVFGGGAQGAAPGVARITNQVHPNVGCPAAVVYKGGPLIEHVKVVTVFWGPAANPYKSQLESFFTAITNSPYFDWLSEYNVTTPTPFSINRGSWIMSFQDSNPTNGSKTILDSDIQAELRKLVDTGTLSTDADTLFMIYFPSDYSITDAFGEKSCSVICGYHAHYTSTSGAPIRYAVLPDVTQPPCSTSAAGGCGLSTIQFNNLTSVSSHELVEAVTDPNTPDTLSWYNSLCGEIGDECNAEEGTVGNLTVQREWSNKYKKCIITPDDFSLTLSPTLATVPAGGSTTVQVNSTIVAGAAVSMALTTSVLPAGVTASFSPAPLQSGSSSTLTFNVDPSTAPGSYAYFVIGTAPNTTHKILGTLEVDDAADMAAPPDAGDSPDLAAPADLAVGDDLAIPSDLATPPDSGSAGADDLGAGGPGSDLAGGPNPHNPAPPDLGRFVVKTPFEVNSGCGCAVGAREVDGSAAWGLLPLAAFALLRRRRRA